MPEAIEAYLNHLRGAGVSFEVCTDLRRDPDHVGSLIEPGPRPRRFVDLAPRTILEDDDIDGGLGSDHASMSVAREIARLGPALEGRRVLELGCGTGLLAIQAALFGARVVGTDLDERVLELAAGNAELNDVEIEWRKGSLCEPLKQDERFDLVIANLPHKPSSRSGLLPLAQDGGPEGDALFGRAAADLVDHMSSDSTLLFFMHSLPHPRLLANLAHRYELSLRRWKLRFIAPGEYRNLIEDFRLRARAGLSFLHQEDGREALVACVWEAKRKAVGA